MSHNDEREPIWNSFRTLVFYILVAFVVCFSLTLNMLLQHQYADHIDNLSNDIIAQSNENVIDKTSDYLKPAVLLAKTTSRMATNGSLDLTDKSQLENLFIAILKPYPQLQSIFYGDEDGNFFMVRRSGENTLTKEVIVDIEKVTTMYKSRSSDNDILDQRTTNREFYDPRQRPWYQGAVDNKGEFWTDVYKFYTFNELGITASHPVFESGQLKGVFGVDISLKNISTFLNNQRISKKGHMMILDEHNKVVALPSDLEKEDMVLPVSVRDLNREELNKAIDIRDVYNATRFTYTTNGKDYFASFVEFPTDIGRQWTTALIVPSQALNINKVVINRLFFIFLGISILIVYLISILLSRSIFDPIYVLINDIKNVGRNIIDDSVVFQKSVKEVNILIDTFKDMKKSIKSFLD